MYSVVSVEKSHSPSIWATLREAVRGSHQDYTEAPIGRAVVLLSVPMVLEMLMESVFAVADIFFVGRLGADAVATVGITESLMTTLAWVLAYPLGFGPTGVFIAVSVAFSTLALVSASLFRKGHWKLQRV
jgi:Na+-driven multidrug efflux pump